MKTAKLLDCALIGVCAVIKAPPIIYINIILCGGVGGVSVGV